MSLIHFCVILAQSYKHEWREPDDGLQLCSEDSGNSGAGTNLVRKLSALFGNTRLCSETIAYQRSFTMGTEARAAGTKRGKRSEKVMKRNQVKKFLLGRWRARNHRSLGFLLTPGYSPGEKFSVLRFAPS